MRTIAQLHIPQIITILFCFSIFLRYLGGDFHLINIGIPIALTISLSLYYSFQSKKAFVYNSYTLLVIFFILYLFLGTSYSKASNYGFQKTIILFLFIVMSITSARYIVSNFKLFLFSNFVLFIAFISIYFILYGNFSNVLGLLSISQRTEMGAGVFGVIPASRYIGFNLICMFYLFFLYCPKMRFKKLLFIFISCIGIIMMILFGSKGPILSLIAAPFLLLLFHKKNSFKKNIILLFSIGIFLTILIKPEYILKIIPFKYQTYFEYRYFNYEGYLNDRPKLIKKAIADIDNNTFLFGKGTGNFGYLYSHKDIQIYPHNIFIEFLYENGLFGLLLFLFILLKNLVTKSTLSEYISSSSCILVLIYYFLINAQVSGDFSNNFLIFIFLILLQFQIKNEKELHDIIQVINKLNLRQKNFSRI